MLQNSHTWRNEPKFSVRAFGRVDMAVVVVVSQPHTLLWKVKDVDNFHRKRNCGAYWTFFNVELSLVVRGDEWSKNCAQDVGTPRV